MDLLVIEAGVEAPRQESVRLRRALRGLPVSIDIVVAAPEHIERYGNVVGMIYQPALREGKTLYDRSSDA